jgi:oxygen-independent coproporphyrinogen-3 oxidase
MDTGLSDPFIEALEKEIDIRKEYLSGEPIETIYFGGGTPSVLDHTRIRRILDKIRKTFKIVEQPEITIEVNPDDISRQFYNSLLREGVNRLSIGVQSWDNSTLKFLNRRHSASQARKAVQEALTAGFTNISIDLIYGIPGLTQKGWEKTLDTTFNYQITHLSAYHLTIEKETMFGKMKELGQIEEIGESDSESQFNALVARSKEAGFIQYEISNLSLDGMFSKHNTNYWRQVPYIGLGPSAHSYNGYSRQWNIYDIKSYIKSLVNNKLLFEKEILDSKMIYNEYIMTSLRTMWGAELEYIESAFSKEAHDYLINMANRFIKYGMLNLTDNNRLVLTDQGKLISDNIISGLMMDDLI